MNTPKNTVLFVHVAISTTILLILLSIMMLWWYPKGLFTIAGGWGGLKILLPIDMVLGPALTFLFYKPGKKSARLDLSMIACVQAIALSYGVYAVYSQHPKALVLAEGQLVTLTPLDEKEAADALSKDSREIRVPAELDSNHPPVVVAEPFTAENFGQYLEDILNDGLELALRADRYQDQSTGSNTLLEAQLSAEQVADKLGKTANPELAYYSLRSMHGTGIAVFSKESKELLRVEPLIQKPTTAALEQTP